jgi:hypothetical protein
MRLSLLCLACLAAGILIGRATGSERASATPAARTYVLHQGDVARTPAAATRCVASQEGGAPNLFCSRTPRGRYQVVFYADSFLVYKIGYPDDPAFSARWRP